MLFLVCITIVSMLGILYIIIKEIYDDIKGG
jgi:hypothetical protein